MLFDATAFAGRWPFRRLGRQTPAEVAADASERGIAGGLISSLEAIFYNDPEQGNRPLAESLPSGYKLALTHSPLLPYAADEVRANELGAISLRLFPGYHGYAPDEDRAVDLCRAAAAAGLLISVVVRLDDIRIDYIVRQQIPSVASVVALAEKVPEGKFVLSGALLGETLSNAGPIAQRDNLWVDIGFCSGAAMAYDSLLAVLPAGKMLFSTFYPMQCMDSSLLHLRTAPLSPQDRDAIGAGNLMGLLED